MAGWATLVTPALAAKRMTPQQLQELVASAQLRHLKDDAVQRMVADVELTSPLSFGMFRQLVGGGPSGGRSGGLGPKAVEALRSLMAASAFVEMPTGEMSAEARPEIAVQKTIVGQVVHYIARIQPTLPNFLATRETWQYDSLPAGTGIWDWPVRDGLYFRGHLEAPIAFRDGRETDDPTLEVNVTPTKAKGRARAPVVRGLTSWGEFGPILGTVLVDAAKGKLSWSRWEMLDERKVAVFQFSVDRANSHYTIQNKGGGAKEVVGRHFGTASTGYGPGGGASKGMVREGEATTQRQAVGYHGSMAVDPDTGTILRISIVADLLPEDPVVRSAMMVEYSPVKIGEVLCTCPAHSVSVSASNVPYQHSLVSAISTVRETQINDVAFTGYRRFGSEAVMIADVAGTTGEANPGQASTVQTNPGQADPGQANPVEARLKATAGSVGETVAALGPAVVSPKVVTGPPEALAKPEAEVDVSTLEEMPSADTAAATPFTLKATTRLVDIGLVALDKKGKPLTDLKPDEVQVYDNGRVQHVVAFHHVDPAGAAAKVSAVPETDTYTNVRTTQPETGDEPDLLILLIDESHLPFNDLNRARGEVLRYLKTMRTTARVALYGLSEHGFHVIEDVTADRAQVAAKLAKWIPDAGAVSKAQELERRNRQQFDTVHSTRDLNSVNGNHIETPDGIATVDPELRQMGDDPLASALGSIVALARHFSTVPGHKSLAWISGDSALVNWDDRAVGTEKGRHDLTAALNHTKEALNEAHVALYAVDASAIPVGAAAVDASLYSANVQLNPTATANSAPGGGSARDTGVGRMSEQLQTDTRGIQGPVRVLAESTGGRAVNKGGDLKAILDGIESDSTALYEIGFAPDMAADGKFHTLTLKVPERKDVKLRYRAGYLYREEATSPKERLERAVWSPQDGRGIALTAEVVPAGESATGKGEVRVRIGFSGLALENRGDRWTDNLYIFTAVRDDATQQSEVSGDTLRLSLLPATRDSGLPAGIPYRREVEMPAGRGKFASVRVIVIDGNSGEVGSVTLPGAAFRP